MKTTTSHQSRISERETRDSTIKWEENSERIVSGESEFNRLKGFQNILLSMVDEFNLGS
jgi:hypothetical protein